MAEIITCTECQRKLQVPESFIGQKVQCPECGHQFVAQVHPQAVQSQPPVPVPIESTAKNDSPRRRRYEDDDDDDYDDDFERMRPIRHAGVPHRGGAIFALGIVAWVVLITMPICAPIAWLMGNSDMARIRAGEMDPSGEGLVQAGRILGIIGTIVSLVVFVPFCLLCGLGILSGR